MLPDGFHWRPWCEGRALYLGDRQIAILTLVRDGHVRTNTNPDRAFRGYEFHDSEDRAVRWLEAWARKWEAKLREEYLPAKKQSPREAG